MSAGHVTGLLLALLQAAGTPPAAQGVTGIAAARHQSRWHWTAQGDDHRGLIVKIVRGSYRIVREQGPARVDMIVTAASSDPAAVGFNVESASSVTISDVYPASRSQSWKECLPPPDARGDFWDSDAVIEATIHAPQSMPVSVDVMERRDWRRP